MSGKIIVFIDSTEWIEEISKFNLGMNSTDEEILKAIFPELQKRFDITMKDLEELYKIKKNTETESIYFIPNSIAG